MFGFARRKTCFAKMEIRTQGTFPGTWIFGTRTGDCILRGDYVCLPVCGHPLVGFRSKSLVGFWSNPLAVFWSSPLAVFWSSPLAVFWVGGHQKLVRILTNFWDDPEKVFGGSVGKKWRRPRGSVFPAPM